MSSSEFPMMDAPEGKDAKLEAYLRRAAADFPYPQTPNIAAHERERLTGQEHRPRRTPSFAYVLVLIVLVLTAAMMVSPVRARVLDWIRIGAVRIFFNDPTITPTLPAHTETPAPAGTVIATPQPTALDSVLDLAGETTLERAREQLTPPILLPAYPEDLGEPDRVYLQQFNMPVVVLVWMDREQPGRVRMSLSQTAAAQPIFSKFDPRSVQDTQVSGEPAVWVEGDYVLVTRDGNTTMSRLITQGHTLIWTSGEITFRLETDENLEEAIRIAESIR